MGRFDEWLTDDMSQKRREPDNDSAQAAAPAPIAENTQCAEENDTDAEHTFSNLEDTSAIMGANNHPDSCGAGGHDEAESDPDVALLPTALAKRDQNTGLKTRYNGHKAFNDQIRDDWMLIIESSPDAFQALLYRPDVGTFGVVDDDTGEEAFTELDNNQRELTYQEPEIVFVVDNPDGRESFQAVDADGEQDGLTDDVLVLRIAASDVTIGSILEWNEEMTHGTARRWWYVHRIFSYGTQHVGSLYYCIPARNFDSTNEGVIL